MAEPAKATVQRVTQDAQVDTMGKIQQITRVQFMVGEHGPFQHSIPSAEFTAEKARSAMNATAAEINKLLAGEQG